VSWDGNLTDVYFDVGTLSRGQYQTKRKQKWMETHRTVDRNVDISDLALHKFNMIIILNSVWVADDDLILRFFQIGPDF
jgi:hypothetical protein